MAESIDDVTKTIYVNWYHACTIINVDITTKKHMQRQKVLDFGSFIFRYQVPFSVQINPVFSHAGIHFHTAHTALGK